MKLIENTPLNTHIIAGLIRARDDLYLVWPLATHPFDHEQWRQALDPEVGNKSFLVYHGDDRIGHAALRVTANPRTYMVSFLFLLPEIRSKGYGTRLLDRLETYAKNQLSAEELVLVVRSYNPRAIKCYTQSRLPHCCKNQSGIKVLLSKLPDPSDTLFSVGGVVF